MSLRSSPTGYLHLGSARTALFNWLTARHAGGEMLLRIEDTDVERSKPELIDLILRSLEWLGIDWDGEIVFQSQRADAHRAAVERLVADGRAYWCDLTPDQIQERAKERGGKPGYDGYSRDRGLGPGPGHVLRFRTPDEGDTVIDDVIRGEVRFANADIEDFVIQRATGTPLFLLANAVDDLDMGITHVIRGEDLLSATPKVELLREAIGATAPPTYAHLPLIVNEKRQKLSKRRDDVALEDYQQRGILPEAMANYLTTLGWGAPDGVEIRPMAEIIELFELDHVTKSSAFFDVKKLMAFNAHYVRAMTTEEFIYSTQNDSILTAKSWGPEAAASPEFAAMAPLVQERVRSTNEVADMIDFLFLPEPVVDPDSWTKVMDKDPELAVRMLDAGLELLAALPDWTASAINDAVIGYADANELSRKKAQGPIRVAVTGRAVGPPLWEAMEILGRDASLDRLRAARASLAA